MSLTLKIAHNDWEIAPDEDQCTPAKEVEAWLAGVRQVTKLGQIPAHRAADVLTFDAYKHLSGMEIWAWMGHTDAVTGRPPLTIIMVSFDDSTTRTFMVERAWLLGPNGDTIERIAP